MTQHRNPFIGSRIGAGAAKLALAAIWIISSGAALGQSWPAKPMRIVNGFPPGGPIDLIARLVATDLGDKLGQSAIVENKPGAAGVLAADQVAKAGADGYTFFLMPSAHATLVGLQGSLPFNPVDDFAMISMLANSPFAVATRPGTPYNSLKDVIEGARAKPGAIAYGTGGVGSGPHLVAVLLLSGAGVQMNHIPYKGGNAHVLGLISGEVPVLFTPIGGLSSFIDSGKMRLLAVSTKQRYPGLPNVPTIAETLLPDFDVSAWYALAGPKNLPAPIVSRVNQLLQAAIARPDFLGKLRGLGAEPWGSSPSEAQAFLAAEVSRWTRVIREQKIETQQP